RLRVHGAGFVLGAGFGVLGAEFGVRGFGFWRPNPEPRTLNPEPRTPNPEPRTPNRERTLHAAPCAPNPSTSEVMTAREEIADRNEVQQHDTETERRQIRGAAAAPSDPAREQLERVHRPADERNEDLRILQRHRLDARIDRTVRAPCFGGPDDADQDAEGQE